MADAPERIFVLGLDPAWAGPTGWAFVEHPDRLLDCGFFKPMKYKGKVTEAVQVSRSQYMADQVNRIVQKCRFDRRAVVFGVRSSFTLAYESDESWMLGAARDPRSKRRGRRRPVSLNSILSVGYVKQAIWQVCVWSELVPIPISSKEARKIVLAGLHVPRPVADIARELAEGDRVKAQVIAGVAVRFGGDDPAGWLEKNRITDHEADGIVVASAVASDLHFQARKEKL